MRGAAAAKNAAIVPRLTVIAMLATKGEKMISKSYPYLSIAKKHNLPYEKVLAVAHAATYRTTIPECMRFSDGITFSGAVIADINKAVDYFLSVRSGVTPFQ